jgi:ATP-dependent protease ClpP protease subunit
MNKILALLLGLTLFVPPAVADKEQNKKSVAAALCTPNKSPCIRGISINGEAIDRDIALFVSMKIQEAYEDGADAVILIINTPGGEVNASRLIHIALTLSPIPVHCVTTTLAASGGFWALEGCYERAATKDAKLMIHEPAAIASRPAKAKELEQMADELREMAAMMAQDIAPRMGMHPQAFLDKIAEDDWWMDAEEALKQGAIDLITPNLETYIHAVKSKYTKKAK